MSTQDFVSTLQIGQVWESIWKPDVEVPNWMDGLCVLAAVDPVRKCVIWTNGEETSLDELNLGWMFTSERKSSFIVNELCWAKTSRIRPNPFALSTSKTKAVQVSPDKPVTVGESPVYRVWLAESANLPILAVASDNGGVAALTRGDVLISNGLAIFRFREIHISDSIATGYSFV